MAKLYITEYSGGLPLSMPVAAGRPVVDQTPVVIGAGSLPSAAFNADTKLIRVHTDAVCSILIGTNPTATVNTSRMAADQTEYFYVIPGDKIAVIANT